MKMDKSRKSRLVLRKNAKEQMSSYSVHFTGVPAVRLLLTISIANSSVFCGLELLKYCGFAPL